MRRRRGARSGSRTVGTGKNFVGGRTRSTGSGGYRGVLEFDRAENPRAGGQFRRELAFTASFSPAELAEITGAKQKPGLEDEFVVVQGVADLVVLLPEEIWLVDFKTDEIRADELPDKTEALRAATETLRASAGKNLFATGHQRAGCTFWRREQRLNFEWGGHMPPLQSRIHSGDSSENPSPAFSGTGGAAEAGFGGCVSAGAFPSRRRTSAGRRSRP